MQKERTAIADARDASRRPCHPGTILEQSLSGPSLSRGKKKSGGLPISRSRVAAHCSQAKTGRGVLWLVDTSGMRRATRFNCGIRKKKPKTKIQPTHQAGAGNHRRLIPQPLTYREQGQNLAGVPCDISVVVSVYAPGNICLGAKPTCMRGWQAVLQAREKELWKCIHFHFASICMPAPHHCYSLDKEGNLCLRGRLFSGILLHMGVVKPAILILPSSLLGRIL